MVVDHGGFVNRHEHMHRHMIAWVHGSLDMGRQRSMAKASCTREREELLHAVVPPRFEH